MSGRVTDEQIESAKRINLPSFLMANGFDLKRVGNEYVWKEHDSLYIKDNQAGEYGKWFRFSTNKGGDNISFLKEFMNYSFTEAVEALSGQKAIEYTYTQPKAIRQPEKPKKLEIMENSDCKRAIAYLTKTRKLDYDFVLKLVKTGTVSQEQKTGNVLFKFYDKGKVVGAEKVGTSTEHRYKGIATGSQSNRGYELRRGNGEKAYFFESSIDMLSFAEMYNKELDNCRLISMMGVKPATVTETMKRYNIKPENVYLCSDNDEAGNKFANSLIEQYPDMKRIATNGGIKDWNDLLKSKKESKDLSKSETLNDLIVDTGINIQNNNVPRDFPFSDSEMKILGLPPDADKVIKEIEQKNIMLKAVGRKPLRYPPLNNSSPESNEPIKVLWKENQQVAMEILANKIKDRFSEENSKINFINGRCKDWKHTPEVLRTKENYDILKSQMTIMSDEISQNKKVLYEMADKLKNPEGQKSRNNIEKNDKESNKQIGIGR